MAGRGIFSSPGLTTHSRTGLKLLQDPGGGTTPPRLNNLPQIPDGPVRDGLLAIALAGT